MFATIIKGLIPEPRQPDQPRNYVGRHRNHHVLGAPPEEPGPDAATDAEADGPPLSRTEASTSAPDDATQPVGACGTEHHR